MNETRQKPIKIVHTFAKVIVVIVLLLGCIRSYGEYLNWAAAKDAQAFCGEIEIGSDITLSIANFQKEIGFVKIEGGKSSIRHFGFPNLPELAPKDGHTFKFPGFLMVDAYCEVSLDQNGKVISKRSSVYKPLKI